MTMLDRVFFLLCLVACVGVFVQGWRLLASLQDFRRTNRALIDLVNSISRRVDKLEDSLFNK